MSVSIKSYRSAPHHAPVSVMVICSTKYITEFDVRFIRVKMVTQLEKINSRNKLLCLCKVPVL